MLESLNERLLKVKREQQQKLKWESQLAAYKSEAKEKKRERDDLRQQLLSEEKDVEKLSNPSFTSFLFTVIGKKEDRLDKEKQELLSARLKYDEADCALQQINQSILKLEESLKTLPPVDLIYKEIMEEKERIVRDENSVLTEEYFTLSHKIADLKVKETETAEAIEAGKIVLNTLDHALESLDSAEGWGTFDLFGGGMITTAIKHSHIDDAKEWIHKVQADLRTFQKELADIHMREDMDIDISGLLTFADYFFDGFITDWMVQGRIEDSILKIENQKEEISQLLSHLHQTANSIESSLEAIITKRTAIIENA